MDTDDTFDAMDDCDDSEQFWNDVLGRAERERRQAEYDEDSMDRYGTDSTGLDDPMMREF